MSIFPRKKSIIGCTINNCMIMQKQERSTRGIYYHNYLFVFGFIYYMIIPLLIVKYGLLADYPAIHLLDEYSLSRFFNVYLICCTIVFISFLAGSRIGARSWKRKDVCAKEYLLGKPLIDRFIIPIAIVGLFVAFKNRSALFQGYLAGYDTSLVGAMATIMISAMFWLIYEFVAYKRPSKVVVGTVLIFAVILLGLGSRMYVVIPVLAGMLYLVEYKVIRLRTILFCAFLFAVFVAAMGLIRFGNAINIEGLLYIGFAEPCLTWISAESMFHYSESLNLFSFPHNFLTTFYNFVPSFIFPDKGQYIREIALPYDQPLGATNLIVSLVSNFGIIGSGIFMFCFGYLLSSIRRHYKSIFGVTFYICFCGVIPFQFFRDNFSIVNKVVVMNLLIVPFLLRQFALIFLRRKNKRNEVFIR